MEIVDGEQNRKKNVVLKRYQTNIRANSFTLRVASGWNALPARIQKSKNVNCFKNAYDALKNS